MKSFISIPEVVDDLSISPEAFRVYFCVVRHIVDNETFPTVKQITQKCFDGRYALKETHTRLALRELTKFGLVSGDIETEDYALIHPDKWEVRGAA